MLHYTSFACIGNGLHLVNKQPTFVNKYIKKFFYSSFFYYSSRIMLTIHMNNNFPTIKAIFQIMYLTII